MTEQARAETPLEALTEAFEQRDGGVLVAMSGGVDSCTLAWIADRADTRALAVTVDAESSADREVEAARAFAREHGLAHRVVEHRELDDPDYVANKPDRCYHCRDGLTDRLEALAEEEDLENLAMGYVPDDRHGHTPGRVAARQSGAWFPFVEVGVGKDQVRRLAERIGLDVAERPSNACLSSRIPYGEPVTEAKLEQIEAAEAAVRGIVGVEQVRVRHHGSVARVEVAPDERKALLDHADAVHEALREVGFTWVAMDLIGYRTGALNEALDDA